MDIQTRLKKYLDLKGLTFKEFESICGLSNGTAARLRDTTRVSTFNRIANSIDLNIEWLKTGKGDMMKAFPAIDDVHEDKSEEEEKFYTYKLPIAAVGGSLDGWGPQNPIMPWECERVVSPVSGVDLAVPVVGDSMSPDYPNGSTVYVKKINPQYFINWGQVFVLDTENGSILKEVQPCDDDESCIECHSLNPNGKYKPFKVPKNTIRGMYRVVACVSLR